MDGITEFSPINQKIIKELSFVFAALGQPDLPFIVGSWGDTLSDAEILDMLEQWNAGERPIRIDSPSLS